MKTSTTTEQRDIDKQFDAYSQAIKPISNTALLYIAIVVSMFGFMVLVWSLPFPQLAFLGKYNAYINWASFLIAGLIYYYLRLSPTVSYLLLFVLLGFSYGIIELEQWQKAGGPALWLTGLVVFIIGLTMQLLMNRSAKSNTYLTLVARAPLWLLVSLLRKLNLRY